MTGQHSRVPRCQQGFSLIELMIAVVLGALLIMVVTHLVSTSLATYRTDEYLARVQENGRYAIEALTLDARQAGDRGCARSNINNLLNTAAASYSTGIYFPASNVLRPVSGWEYSGTGNGASYSITTLNPASIALNQWDDAAGSDLDTQFQNRVVPGTDVLIIRRANNRLLIAASGNTAASATTIALTASSGIAQNALVMIADCQKADLFQNRATGSPAPASLDRSTGSGSPGNGAGNLSHAYGTDMEIYTFSINAWYVGTGESGEPALFRRSYAAGGAGVTEELVEGVESMQVLYGEDTTSPVDGVPDVYVTAAGVTDWNNVQALRVGLLLRSVEKGRQEADTGTYNVLGTVITPRAADSRRLRRIFTTTIALRNQVN